MLASIAEVQFTEKPDLNGMDTGSYLDSFICQELEPIDLADRVCKGNSFCNVFDGRPKKENFVLGYVLAVDVDKGELAGMEALLRPPFVRAYAAFIYPTLRSTEEAPRHRVVFCLDEPIREAGDFEYAAKTVYELFPGADTGCANAGRTFLGNGKIRRDGLVVWFGGHTLYLPDLRLLVRQRRAREQVRVVATSPDGGRLVEWATATAQEGERNRLGYWLACRLREAGLGRDEAAKRLLEYQRAVRDRGSCPYTIHEALSSLNSAFGSVSIRYEGKM